MKNRRRRQRSADDETAYVFEIEVCEQSIAVQRGSINRLFSHRIRIIFRSKFIKSMIVRLKSFSYLRWIGKKLAFLYFETFLAHFDRGNANKWRLCVVIARLMIIIYLYGWWSCWTNNDEYDDEGCCWYNDNNDDWHATTLLVRYDQLTPVVIIMLIVMITIIM